MEQKQLKMNCPLKEFLLKNKQSICDNKNIKYKDLSCFYLSCCQF